MWKRIIDILPVLCYVVATTYSERNSTHRALLNFGPITINFYEDVGSQEVIFVQIPAAYLTRFSFEWTFSISSNDKASCPKSNITILVRENGIPIANPQNASYPDRTYISNTDTLRENFQVAAMLPNKDEFLMVFDSSEDVTGEYYVSLFLDARANPDVEIPSSCKYIAVLTVLAPDETEYNKAVIESLYEIQTLNPALYKTNFSLERNRISTLNTIYSTVREGYNMSLNSSMTYSWIVDPYADVGGTLRVDIGLDTPLDGNGTVLKSCLSRNSGEVPSTSWNDCTAGVPIIVDSKNETSATWYWPYPKSGLWVLDVGIECVEESCPDITTIHLDISIITCIENCHSESSQGDCRLYRSDVLYFAACDCKGGWSGIACTDNTHAVPRSRQLLMTLFLTLSNLIFLPCGVVAIVKGYYSESIVYFFVMFFSTFYHACDNDFAVAYCLFPYNTLQFSDFYGSITAMWVTLIAVAKLPFRLESFFHVIGIMAIGVAVTENRFSALTTLIPVLSAFLILAIKWGRQCHATHHCYPGKLDWIFSLIPGAICGIVGFILFAFVEKPSNYFYVHSLWHILMGSAVLFLIPKEKKHSWTSNRVLSSSLEECVVDAPVFYDNVENSQGSGAVLHMEMSDSSSSSD